MSRRPLALTLTAACVAVTAATGIAPAAEARVPAQAVTRSAAKAAPALTAVSTAPQVVLPGGRVVGTFTTRGVRAGTVVLLQEKVGARWVTRASAKSDRTSRAVVRYSVRSIPRDRSATFRGAIAVKGKTLTSRAFVAYLIDPVRNVPPTPDDPALPSPPRIPTTPAPGPTPPSTPKPTPSPTASTRQLQNLDHLFHTGEPTSTFAHRFGKYVDNGWSVFLFPYDGQTASGMDTYRTTGCLDFRAIVRADEGTDGARVTVEILTDGRVAWRRDISPYTEETVSLPLVGTNSISFRASTSAPAEGSTSISADIVDPTFTCR